MAEVLNNVKLCDLEPILDYDEQIENLKNNGVTFNIYSIQDAKKLLF